MALDGPNTFDPDDLGLATRAAWLYHAGGLTQSQVAERLGLTNAKTHRLIARARRAGLVRVFVEGPIGGCIASEDALARRFRLRLCRVVPALDEAADTGGLPLRALGIAAARVLRGALERGEHRIIGLGHGRTLAAAVDHLPGMSVPAIRLVSLLGGLPRRSGANPFDVIHRLAERTGADAYLLPVPFFANTPADRLVLLAQHGVAEAMEMAAQATLSLVGIGEVGNGCFLSTSGAVTEGEVAALRRAGAVGEVLGRYLDAAGQLVATPLHERVIALSPERMRGREVIAVAGGPAKVRAIHAVLRSGLLSGLVTDEATARLLLAVPDADTREKKGRETCTKRKETSAAPS